jgi:hypothetical protein
MPRVQSKARRRGERRKEKIAGPKPMIRLVTEKQSDSRSSIKTVGLASGGHSELRAEVLDPELMEEAEGFLNYVSHYVTTSGKRISPGETMAYGYWLVKFQSANDNTLEAWEYKADATDFVKGADLTLRYWRDQHIVCKLHGAEFRPPRPDKLTVVSAGVLEGAPVEGVRYPSPDHMSGWWITTDQYNGDIKTLQHQHTYHVTAARPELAKYLALPDGFRFDLSGTEAVWLDEKVASAMP